MILLLKNIRNIWYVLVELEIFTLPNLKSLCLDEGFVEVEIRYVGVLGSF